VRPGPEPRAGAEGRRTARPTALRCPAPGRPLTMRDRDHPRRRHRPRQHPLPLGRLHRAQPGGDGRVARLDHRPPADPDRAVPEGRLREVRVERVPVRHPGVGPVPALPPRLRVLRRPRHQARAARLQGGAPALPAALPGRPAHARGAAGARGEGRRPHRRPPQRGRASPAPARPRRPLRRRLHAARLRPPGEHRPRDPPPGRRRALRGPHARRRAAAERREAQPGRAPPRPRRPRAGRERGRLRGRQRAQGHDARARVRRPRRLGRVRDLRVARVPRAARRHLRAGGHAAPRRRRGRGALAARHLLVHAGPRDPGRRPLVRAALRGLARARGRVRRSRARRFFAGVRGRSPRSE
jgi:hypothetical protein